MQVDTWRSTYKGIMSDDFLAALSYEQRAKAWHNILSDPKPNQFAYVAMQDAKEVIGFAVGGQSVAATLSMPANCTRYTCSRRFNAKDLGIA